MSERITLEQLKERYGHVSMGDKSVDVVSVMSSFKGQTVNTKAVAEEMAKQVGQEVEAVYALDVIDNASKLMKVEWDRNGGGFKIGSDYTEPPVLFWGPNLQNKIVAADEADEFSKLNPDWQRKEDRF